MRSDKEFLEAVTGKLEKARAEALAKSARRRKAAAILLPAAAALGIVIGGSLALWGKVAMPESTPLHQIEERPSVAETDPVKIVQETPGASSKPEIDPGTVPETEKDTEPETQPAAPRMRVVYADPKVFSEEGSLYDDFWKGGVRGQLGQLLELYEGETVWFSVRIDVRPDPYALPAREDIEKQLEPLWESYRTQIDACSLKTGEIEKDDPVNGRSLGQWYGAESAILQYEQQTAYNKAEKEIRYARRVPAWEEAGNKLAGLGAEEIRQEADYGGRFTALMTGEMIRALAEEKDQYAIWAAPRRVRTTDGSVLSDELREWLDEAALETRFVIAVSLRIDAYNQSLQGGHLMSWGLLVDPSVNEDKTELLESYLPPVVYEDYESYRSAIEQGAQPLLEMSMTCLGETPHERLQAVIDRNGLSEKVSARNVGDMKTPYRRVYSIGKCTAEWYLEGVYAGFQAKDLTAAEILALAEDPDIKLIVGVDRYLETYRAGGKVDVSLAKYMAKMSETERISVTIQADDSNYGRMSSSEIEAALLAQFGWNKTEDAPHDLTLEQIYAYREARNEMIYGSSRRAAEALWTKFSANGLFPDAANARLISAGYTYITASLTRDEILAIAADPDVSLIVSYTIPEEWENLEAYKE